MCLPHLHECVVGVGVGRHSQGFVGVERLRGAPAGHPPLAVWHEQREASGHSGAAKRAKLQKESPRCRFGATQGEARRRLTLDRPSGSRPPPPG
jgi:hypothetical protein